MNTRSAANSFLVELKEVDRDFYFERDPALNHSAEKVTAKAGAKLQTKLHALARVSLKLGPGEFVFLTGPSGAGKTTLLRLVLGLDQPSSGEVYTLGCAVHEMNEDQRRALRRRIGIVFQDHRLLSSLNVAENVELPLYFTDLDARERRRRVSEILEVVQMHDLAAASVHTLSAGEKQRIAIARALAHCPQLIVADEPTGNLDPVSARSLVRMLRELRGYGTTVLIATHDMSLVRDFGGRVLELIGGTLPSQAGAAQNRAYKVPHFWTANANDRNVGAGS